MKSTSRITTIALLAILLSACSLMAPKTVWIDVRSLDEYNEDHISNTEHIPHTEIVAQISDLDLDKSAPIKLFCRSGVRAGLALTALQDLGYTNVENVGGIADARVVLSQ
jgi:phage shock protein E|tara:strand:- start:367 stop:696 length:330 start_codon:yes stop_codon:yes gene_type:complete